MRKKMQEKKSIKNTRFRTPVILLTLFVQLALATYLCCLFIFYGPLANLRRFVVDTAMNTYSHQFIARVFLSDDAIRKIMSDGTSAKAAKQKITDIKVQNFDNKNIEQYEIKGNQYHGYLLVVSDPTRVKVGLTKQLLKVGETTSGIAKDHNAVAAINGGGFSGGSTWVGTGAEPTDFVFSNGKLAFRQSGLKTSSICNCIALSGQGKLIVGNHSANDLERLGVTDAVTMPGYQPLIVNGSGVYSGDGGAGFNPRTAIGQRRDGSILLLALDGRRVNMLGATLRDVQNILLSKGAYTAAALDGGSSTTMYYDGQIINNPCSAFGERTVSTAFYVTR